MPEEGKAEQIKAEKIRRIIEAGIQSKKGDPQSDLTPLSYKRLEDYIVFLEEKVIQLGGEIPKVVY